MRLVTLLALAVVLGFTPPPDGERQLRVVSEHGVDIIEMKGTDHTGRLAGPRVVIELEGSTSLEFTGLDGTPAGGRYDAETGRTVLNGSYEITVLSGDEVQGRLRVRHATLVLGWFAEDEGWEGLGD